MQMDSRPRRRHSGLRAAPRAAGHALAAAFVLLTLYFVYGPGLLDMPHTEVAFVAREDVTSEPLRALPAHPPVILRGGYELRCMECHRLFVSRTERVDPARSLMQHQEIVLDHGLNERCFNCHDRFDRNMLLLPGGERIKFSEAERLCATCHGTVYRDWERGMHGRTTGSWIESHPEHRRLSCVECHDPHAPAFGSMSLLPGPNTIRMSPAHHDPHEQHVPSRKRNPLRRWRNVASGSGRTSTHRALGSAHAREDC